jgi:hypothetical protein
MESELTNRKGTVRDSAFAVNALAIQAGALGNTGGASRIRTADLWIMIPSL